MLMKIKQKKLSFDKSFMAKSATNTRRSIRRPATPATQLDELEKTLLAAASTAHELRLNHDKVMKQAAQRPRTKSSRAKFRRSIRRLNTQIEESVKLANRFNIQEKTPAPLPSPTRKKQSGAHDADKLGVITKEEAIIQELAESSKADTDYGKASRRELREREPVSQRRLNRIANSLSSTKVRGRAGQAVQFVEDSKEEAQEKESQDRSLSVTM